MWCVCVFVCTFFLPELSITSFHSLCGVQYLIYQSHLRRSGCTRDCCFTSTEKVERAATATQHFIAPPLSAIKLHSTRRQRNSCKRRDTLHLVSSYTVDLEFRRAYR